MSRRFIVVASGDDTCPQFDFYHRAAEVSNTYELIWSGSQWKRVCGDYYTTDGKIHRRRFVFGSDELEVYEVDSRTVYLVDYHWKRVMLVTR